VSSSLLEATRRLIERTYATPTGVDDVSRFVVGDEGLRRIQRQDPPVHHLDGPGEHGQPGPPGPQVLLRVMESSLGLAIYFPDALIRRLEEDPPTLSLHADNVDDFAHFIEEVDHFVALAHGLALGREMHLLELEIRANVTKALVLHHFVGKLSRRLSLREEDRLWVRHHLFEKHGFVDAEGLPADRYREARRLAVRLLDRVKDLPPRARLVELRRWNDLPAPLKVRELAGR
jgi:hypothetical protein